MLCALGQEKPLIYTWHFVYIVHTLSLCACPVHLKRPQFACSGLLNQRPWEAAALPQGRPCSTLVRVRYATAITVDAGGKNVWGGRLKVLSALCFERGRTIAPPMAGYIPPQKYLTSVCRAAPVWTLHKDVIFFFLSLCNWEFETLLLLLMSSRLRMLILSYRPMLWSIRLFVWFFFLMVKHINSFFCKASISQHSCISADTHWNPPFSASTSLPSP